MSAHTVTIQITPLCSSCGNELVVGPLQSRSTGHPIDRDCPDSRTDQRLFVSNCPDCFIFKSRRRVECFDSAVAALAIVRMSAAWAMLAVETRDLIDAAIAKSQGGAT